MQQQRQRQRSDGGQRRGKNRRKNDRHHNNDAGSRGRTTTTAGSNFESEEDSALRDATEFLLGRLQPARDRQACKGVVSQQLQGESSADGADNDANELDEGDRRFFNSVNCALKVRPELISTVDKHLGYTPLHRVCSRIHRSSNDSNNLDAAFVRRFLECCPPTHPQLQPLLPMAVPPEVAANIVQFVPNPCLMKDSHGKTPLFLVCQRSKKRHHGRPDYAIAKLLYRYAPEAACIPDKTGRTPVEILQRQNAKTEDEERILDMLLLNNNNNAEAKFGSVRLGSNSGL